MESAAQKSSYLNLPAWLLERFPPINFISAFVMYFMLALSFHHLSGGAVSLTTHLLGAVALSCFFLLMRISDEFKDFALDSELYPERVLQSGRIERKHLSALAGIAVFVMIGVSFSRQGLAPWFCVLNLFFVLMLNREFFCGAWLRAHMLTCTLLHMLVASTSSLWILSLSGGEIYSRSVLLLILLPYASGLTFEFARKCFGAEENRPGLESYTRILGLKKAVAWLGFAMIATDVAFAAVIETFYPERLAPALMISLPLFALAAVALGSFALKPRKKGRKLNEAFCGLLILGNYLTLIGFGLWT